MTHRFILPLVALASAALLACGSDSSTSTDTSATAAAGPGAYAADFKTSAIFFTNMAAPVKGSSPHGTVRVWYSSNVKDLVATSSFTAPEGTVAIKEFDMTGDGSKRGIAVMIKKPAGYDPSHGDWYYDMRDPSGNVMADPPAGPTKMCIDCHVGFPATDFLGSTALR